MPLNRSAGVPDPQPRHHPAPTTAPQPSAVNSDPRSNPDPTPATHLSHNSSAATQPRDTAAVQQEALRVTATETRVTVTETRATGSNADLGWGQPQGPQDVGTVSQLAAARRVDVQSAQTLHEVRGGRGRGKDCVAGSACPGCWRKLTGCVRQPCCVDMRRWPKMSDDVRRCQTMSGNIGVTLLGGDV